MMEYRPIFPENMRAARLPLKAQVFKVIEEAEEVYRAIKDKESNARIIEETLDTIHACEGVLRKFRPQEIEEAIKLVYEKNKSRGDYL